MKQLDVNNLLLPSLSIYVNKKTGKESLKSYEPRASRDPLIKRILGNNPNANFDEIMFGKKGKGRKKKGGFFKI